MSDVIPLSSPKPRRNRLAGDSLADDELVSVTSPMYDVPTVTSAPRRPRRQPSLVAQFMDVRTVLHAVDSAMRAEDIGRDVRQRVANRLMWNNPDGVSE